jgi:outer membrane receptor for ferrienterochelin and colicins
VTALRYDYFSDGKLSRFTPKLSARYQPQRNLNVRLGYGMGFRAPTLKEKYYEFDMSGIWVVEGNEQLKAEMSHNFNASVEDAKNGYNLMVMGYYNDVRDKISTGIPYYRSQESRQLYLPYTNLDNYSVYGADVSVRGRWDCVTAKLGYAFTKEQLPSAEDGKTINNQYIPARPHALNWEVAFDKAFTEDYTLSLTLSGRLLSGVDNEEYLDYYDISKGTATICYPAYSLWKLIIAQRLWNKARLSVTIDNLINYKPEYYYLNAPVTDGTNLMIGLAIDLD